MRSLRSSIRFKTKCLEAGLYIKPQAKNAPAELLRKMVRSIGLDPEKVLVKEALSEPHRIHAMPQEREEEEIALLTRALVEAIKDQSKQPPIP